MRAAIFRCFPIWIFTALFYQLNIMQKIGAKILIRFNYHWSWFIVYSFSRLAWYKVKRTLASISYDCNLNCVSSCSIRFDLKKLIAHCSINANQCRSLFIRGWSPSWYGCTDLMVVGDSRPLNVVAWLKPVENDEHNHPWYFYQNTNIGWLSSYSLEMMFSRNLRWVRLMWWLWHHHHRDWIARR